MRLLVGTQMSSEYQHWVSDYRRSLSESRSRGLTGGLRRRLDVLARKTVAARGSRFGFSAPIEDHLISHGAWEHVRHLNLNPVSVFCPSDMLVEEPFVSLYYRGISGLSLKEVQIQARSVVSWEVEPEVRRRKPRVTAAAAAQVAGLYNSVISSIIENTTDWTLENGYRNMIASLGITFDGSMRNTIGRIPEQRIRRLLLQHAFERGLLRSPTYRDVDELPSEPPNEKYSLTDNVVMAFSSEPDVAFRRGDSLEATIEIKGGIDPAGALERLGGAQKSADAALAQNAHCKNFLIAGVITPRMRERLDQRRLFEKDFLLVELLYDEVRRSEFFDEIFNHTLRLTTTLR